MRLVLPVALDRIQEAGKGKHPLGGFAMKKELIANAAVAIMSMTLLCSCAVAQAGTGTGSSSPSPMASGKNNMSNPSGMSDSSATATKSGTSLSLADKTFVRKAAQGGMAEVQFGQLATEKAASDDVKKFGQRMVDDHTKANDQLKALASGKGIDVPQSLSLKDKATLNQLSKLSGAAFDRAYMKDMVMDHTQDVAEFQHESKLAKDPDVKNFAAQTLPTLQDHLQQAKSLAPSSKSSAGSKMSGGTE
jgi:putative membrane protein